MPVELLNDSVIASSRAMASAVSITVPRATATQVQLEALLHRALRVFEDVEVACTRFNPSSPLMRTNESPARWHRVPAVLYRALREAYEAYERTGGVFDPRVLDTLVALGYDATLSFEGPDVRVGARTVARAHRGAWRPRFRAHKCDVWLGDAVELGGIGKGLAVRWASDVLAPRLRDYLIEAGGDCYLAGRAPDGEPWRVGVEDPGGATTPVAVLALSDRAVATSSTRLRHWRVGEQRAHHLIDPRTGACGGDGLVAVTVVGADTARAEVDSKVLFLAGREAIADAAAATGVAALWCDDEGGVTINEAMRPYVAWERS
ncbi:MAG: FAD:protein FMN transferase [Acidobacteria bacterium]|nr:FAD:protein FMN transferase [Acidobacteriota bacterium]